MYRIILIFLVIKSQATIQLGRIQNATWIWDLLHIDNDYINISNITCEQCLCRMIEMTNQTTSISCQQNQKTCQLLFYNATAPLRIDTDSVIYFRKSANFLQTTNNQQRVTTIWPKTSAYSTKDQSSTVSTAVESLITGTNETVYGIWNTIAGGNSSPSTAGSSVGQYYPGEEPSMIFDRNITTKYTSFGNCSNDQVNCGQNTGIYFTPLRGLSILRNLRFCTANSLPERDPITVTLEGSNQPSSALTYGSSWTVIYNGSTGLDTTLTRYTFGTVRNLLNFVSYRSYRLLVTSTRNISDAVQYAEVELNGY